MLCYIEVGPLAFCKKVPANPLSECMDCKLSKALMISVDPSLVIAFTTI